MKSRQALSVRHSSALAAVFVVGTHGIAWATLSAEQRRPPTVRDGIAMSEPAFPEYVSNSSPPCGYGSDWQPIGAVSPNGEEVVAVVRQGDMGRGVNRYRMLLWKTSEIGVEKPRTVLQISSSSKEPGIDPASVRWAQDSQSLTFLAAGPGEHEQVYQLNMSSGDLVALTHSAVSVEGYGLSGDGSVLAYETVVGARTTTLWNTDTRRHGLVVTTQGVLPITLGRMFSLAGMNHIYVRDGRGTREIIALPGSYIRSYPFMDSENDVSVSPDGRYAVDRETLPPWERPEVWRRYDDAYLKLVISTFGGGFGTLEAPRYDWSGFTRYVLKDLQSGDGKVLLNVPIRFNVGIPVVWAPDGGSVVFSHTLLPIREGMTAAEIQRASEPATVEVNVRTGDVTRVGSECDQAISWDKSGLTCSTATEWSLGRALAAEVYPTSANTKADVGNTCRATKLVRFQKIGGRWNRVAAEQPVVDVLDREGRNSPPVLVYRLRGQKHFSTLLDLNPQLSDVALAKEQAITWEWSKGHTTTAGLYWPTHYVPGRRYPLVIQTHGFDANVNRFMFWGSSTTSDAAQALAGRGMFVLQVSDGDPKLINRRYPWGQLLEVRRAVDIYKSAIAYLDGKGLVDPKEVGIIGWSHTVFFVHWALTHNPDLFAAATVAEGGVGSYVEYMLNIGGDIVDETLYGGPPFGVENLRSWMRRSPDLLMDRVRSPLMILQIHHEGAMDEWEWLQGLRDLRKPVEMLVLDGRSQDGHDLQEPWNQAIVSGANVDWFDFWLNGHEDNSPGKRAQYARWRLLRSLQGAERGGRHQRITWTELESTTRGM